MLGALVGQLPIVATVRTGEARSGFVLTVVDLLGLSRVDLGALEPEASQELVQQLHPELGVDDRERLVAVAAGNPLLLEQLPWSPDLSSPSLVSALMARSAELSPSGRMALDRLAVLARPVHVDVLGDASEELVGVGLADRSGDELVIRHALLADLVVEGLGPSADAVRRGLVPLVEAPEAAHLLEAIGELDAARTIALDAVDGAPDRLRAPLLALAVRCAPDLDPRGRLAAARCYTAISQPSVAVELCAVGDLADLAPLERGGLLIARAEATFALGRQQEALELVTAALEDVRGSGTVLEVLALAGATIANTSVSYDGQSALDQARAAVALADRLGEEQLTARTRLAAVMLIAGEPGWSDLYAEVIAEARSVGDEQARHTAVVGRLIGHWLSGDPVTAEAQAQAEMLAIAHEDYRNSWLILTAYAAVLGMSVGRPPRDLLAEFGPILDREPYFRMRPLLEVTVLVALADDGRHVAAADLAGGSVARAGSEPQARATAHWGVIEVGWLAGRTAETAAEVASLLALGVGDFPGAIQARLVAGHSAREAEMTLQGPAPVPPVPAWEAAAMEWEGLELAVAGDHHAAADRFAVAARAWAGFDARSEARCRWAAGDEARRAGRPDAVALLDEAVELADAGGWVALGSKVRRSLRALGVIRQGTRRAGVGPLTSREVEILDLVGAGRSTAEIAATLGLAPATVDSLIMSARRRLGASTRLAAVASLRRLRGETVGPGSEPR